MPRPVIAAHSSQKNGVAVVFMVTATAFIAATMVLAKALGTDTLGPPLPPFMVTFGRFAFAWLTIAAALAVLRPALSRPDFATHAKRSICGFLGVTCMFAAAARIPLSDATAISFLSPVFAMVLAIPLLGERVGKWRWIAAVIALGGALVLTRPGGGALELGALFALGAAFAYGFEVIFIKRLAGREKPLQLLFVNNSFGLAMASLAVTFTWQMPTPAQWAGLAALGMLMACAQFCFIHSVSRGDASFVTPFMYLTLVFAALYDGALFAVIPDGASFLGAAFILMGAALLAWRERGHAKAAAVPPMSPAQPRHPPN